jgi:SAM-dependent methyltransferase
VTEHRDKKQMFHLEGMLRGVARRMRASVEIVVPAVPSLLDHYVDMLDTQFTSLGRQFTEAELTELRRLLLGKLEEGFAASPHSNVFVRFSTDQFPSMGISYGVASALSTVEEEYALWTATREPPLFGKYPDHKVMDLASELAPTARCLDIGAGTGRNTLPLARRGHPTDAIELSPALADVLERAAKEEKVPVRILRGSVLDDSLALEDGSYDLAIAVELTSHFRSADELRALCERLSRCLAPCGTALVQAFITARDYAPTRHARELSQVFWSTLFTEDDVREATAGLPLTLVSDEGALQYEQSRAPADQWPPTSWYAPWASGHDVFGNYGATPPMNLRWLTYRKDAK